MSRAVVIHGLDQARLALTVAAELGCGVTLISAPGAAGYAGGGWFAALVALLRQEFPDQPLTAVLDAADHPGPALAALRAGVVDLCFTGAEDVAQRLEEIAAGYGARLHRVRPPALDLRHHGRPAVACRAWLAGEDVPG